MLGKFDGLRRLVLVLGTWFGFWKFRGRWVYGWVQSAMEVTVDGLVSGTVSGSGLGLSVHLLGCVLGYRSHARGGSRVRGNSGVRSEVVCDAGDIGRNTFV